MIEMPDTEFVREPGLDKILKNARHVAAAYEIKAAKDILDAVKVLRDKEREMCENRFSKYGNDERIFKMGQIHFANRVLSFTRNAREISSKQAKEN